MIGWPWLLAAGIVGALAGFFLCSCITVGALGERERRKYMKGYAEGVEYGFQEGIKKITEIG